MGKDQYSKPAALLRETLIAARKAAGLTQDELAASLARPQSFISKVESGERRLDVIEFLRMAKAVKIDPASLFTALLDITD